MSGAIRESNSSEQCERLQRIWHKTRGKSQRCHQRLHSKSRVRFQKNQTYAKSLKEQTLFVLGASENTEHFGEI